MNALETGSGTIVSAETHPVAGPSRGRRALFLPIKFVVGMVSCQSILGALVVAGWVLRVMQRGALKEWWRSAGRTKAPGTFAQFLAADPETAGQVSWPNWFLAQDFRGWRTLLSSYVNNVKLGIQGMFNAWVFTLPAGVLWLFGWHFGWDNSFNKGYEQFWVGPALSWLGIFLFMAAMFYVPMAQARQAVTGNWKSFYQFDLVWKLVRRRWLASLGLAVLYAAASIPIMWLSAVPTFFTNINPRVQDYTDRQVLGALNSFYFWSALVFFPAYVFLRMVAARIYASAVLHSVQAGVIPPEALAENEWKALHRLGLLEVRTALPPKTWVRIVQWAGSRAGRATAGFLTALAWFGFVAQIYIREFFNYHVATGWLNQPLVQLPWFHHVPARLQNPGLELLATVGIVVAGWLFLRVARKFRAWRSAGSALET